MQDIALLLLVVVVLMMYGIQRLMMMIMMRMMVMVSRVSTCVGSTVVAVVHIVEVEC